MQIFRQIASGLALGGVFLALLLGGYALSQAEGGIPPASASATLPPASPAGATPAPVFLPTLPPYTQFASATFSFTSTATPPPPPTSCMPPAGWVAVLVQPADSLESLARTYGADKQQIWKQNCLFVEQLAIGSYLYLPPLPTITPIPCGAPAGWVNYLVNPGDTLYSISLLYRISIDDLQNANCLGDSTYILAGTLLRVPNVPPSTPKVSATPLTTLTGIPTTTYILTIGPTLIANLMEIKFIGRKVTLD